MAKQVIDFGIFGGEQEVRELTPEEYDNKDWTGFCIDGTGSYQLMYNLVTDEYAYFAL